MPTNLFHSGFLSILVSGIFFACAAGIIPVRWSSREDNQAFLQRHRLSFIIGGIIMIVDGLMRARGVF